MDLKESICVDHFWRGFARRACHFGIKPWYRWKKHRQDEIRYMAWAVAEAAVARIS